ncbi:hypothetical protein BOTCAL_0124g00150 [Botryotinia calthae]|uniref:Uncharacterized protein n=1 Tax=Botryotinia calthae TaxID=38488 RepID=A0A4Y8D4A8_9HELO|nr:hypothetical protein BOTCAL_0124g00150 [Botryotinia calthae]
MTSKFVQMSPEEKELFKVIVRTSRTPKLVMIKLNAEASVKIDQHHAWTQKDIRPYVLRWWKASDAKANGQVMDSIDDDAGLASEGWKQAHEGAAPTMVKQQIIFRALWENMTTIFD